LEFKLYGGKFVRNAPNSSRMLECGLIVNFLIFVSKKKAQSTKNSFASSEKRVEEQSAGYSFSEINNISMEFNKDFITVSENTINK